MAARRAATKIVRKSGPRAQAIELDSVDREIVARLQRNGRMPNNLLATEVGIAPSTCMARVRRLESTGVIHGYRADVNLNAIGRPIQAMIAIRIQAGARGRIAAFQEFLAGLDGVVNVYFLSGSNDFLVHVATADTDALRAFVVDNLSSAREVAVTQTSLIFDHVTPDTAIAVAP